MPPLGCWMATENKSRKNYTVPRKNKSEFYRTYEMLCDMM